MSAGGRHFWARIWPTCRHLIRVKNPKRSLSVAEMWRSKRQASIWVHEGKKEMHYNLVASCLSKLHSDPTFSITLFSPLGPQAGSGAVPRSPETLWHSPPLRGRPRDALFCIVLSGPVMILLLSSLLSVCISLGQPPLNLLCLRELL